MYVSISFIPRDEVEDNDQSISDEAVDVCADELSLLLSPSHMKAQATGTAAGSSLVNS